MILLKYGYYYSNHYASASQGVPVALLENLPANFREKYDWIMQVDNERQDERSGQHTWSKRNKEAKAVD